MGPEGNLTGGAWYLDASPSSVSNWLLRVRWTRVMVDIVVLIASLAISRADFPLYRLAPLVAVAAFLNGDIAWHASRGRTSPRWMLVATLIVDVVLLTGLLELSGGPSNPFAVIYAVLVALAGAAAGIGWAYFMGVWAALCYGVLSSWHLQGIRRDRAVWLIVRDEGTGMPADVLRRAGEPFFTTKEPGDGFGLGLFLARMFAERLGGTLTRQSDRGTVATLELPLVPAARPGRVRRQRLTRRPATAHASPVAPA